MLPAPVNNSQDNNDTMIQDRALVRADQRGENCIVFGGQYAPKNIDRSRSIQGSLMGLFPPPPSENSIFPDTTMTGDGVQDDEDSEESDPKRLRLTEGYDIALALMDTPRTYNEATASPHAYKWKEAIRLQQSCFLCRSGSITAPTIFVSTRSSAIFDWDWTTFLTMISWDLWVLEIHRQRFLSTENTGVCLR
ncbi:hypothetical protein PsorP6_009779 [Peronosclerospora sorghi]|uniref:Uncharacterized protein n=1 Tax=Peronosclerospora sorghi TaxID=230839 RepID=A0ACC0W1R0_9STRA|nr:hypothetical protein PsorP6_009779 [Peronosclerospora sorghi]